MLSYSYHNQFLESLFITTHDHPLITHFAATRRNLLSKRKISTMISCISWVPKGCANVHPKKFGMSRTEIEMLEKLKSENILGSSEDVVDVSNKEEVGPDVSASNDQNVDTNKQRCDANGLPIELRMDEYSSEEEATEEIDGSADESDERYGSRLGNLLVGDEMVRILKCRIGLSEMKGMRCSFSKTTFLFVMFQGNAEDIDAIDAQSTDSDYDRHDSPHFEENGDVDNLGDVPDTREYTPVDVAGLKAMNLGNVDGEIWQDIEDEDDSDVEDTNLREDDALILVAKTEEVSWLNRIGLSPLFDFD